MERTINSYLESIENPEGRFRSLTDVVYREDEEAMFNTSQTVDFLATVEGEQVLLRCVKPSQKGNIRHSVELLSLIESRHLAGADYLEQELYVFNSKGEPISVDVIVQQIPEGTTFELWMTRHSKSRDKKELEGVAVELVELARWLNEVGVTHGRISASKIYVDSEGKLTLVDYTAAKQEQPVEDIVRLGTMVAALYLTAIEPLFYTYFSNQLSCFSPTTVSALREVAREVPSKLNELLELVEATLHRIDQGKECTEKEKKKLTDNLLKAMSQVAELPLLELPQLTARMEQIYGKSKRKLVVTRHKAEENKKRYKFVGILSDMLMRAWDGEQWCYIDRHGEVEIEGDFIYATDFDEGLAVVESESGYGLINREGQFLLEPHYHDIEWNSKGNVVFATKEGLTGIFSREGTPLSGLIYERLLDVSEGLIAAKRGRHYGYVTREGRTAIPFIYDDALGFRGGLAKVVKDGDQYLIDIEGKVVELVKKGEPQFSF